MPENDTNQPLSQTSSERPDWKRKTRPASEWYQELEGRLAELSAQRRELRQQIRSQTQERGASNTLGEESLSVRMAHQMARNKVLGTEWQRAVTSLQHAAKRVRYLRKQLVRFVAKKYLVRQRSAKWTYWLFKAPKHRISPGKRVH